MQPRRWSTATCIFLLLATSTCMPAALRQVTVTAAVLESIGDGTFVVKVQRMTQLRLLAIFIRATALKGQDLLGLGWKRHETMANRRSERERRGRLGRCEGGSENRVRGPEDLVRSPDAYPILPPPANQKGNIVLPKIGSDEWNGQ
ncbi:hypothetical protein EDB89DRAFT_1910232 [Lactarius sanguifluus]|nr:hypothetical protein EDB89DRAFT_1910232 [Lactarius sanguifluus]